MKNEAEAAGFARGKQMKHAIRPFRVAILAALVLLAGCAAFLGGEADAVTVPEILAMSREGVPAEEIIHRIRESDTVYRLEASQYAELANQGVPPEVLDYMQQTYIDELQRNNFLDERRYWTPGAGYWYGGRPYGWPYDRRF